MTSPNNTNRPTSQSDQGQPAGAVDARRGETNLTYRYGSIGIEAVAAAVRYAGSRKNPAYAPVVTRIEARRYESAV